MPTSAPWNPSSAFAAFQPDDSVRLSLEDYDHAAKCVNAHDDLVRLLQASEALAAKILKKAGETQGMESRWF